MATDLLKRTDYDFTFFTAHFIRCVNFKLSSSKRHGKVQILPKTFEYERTKNKYCGSVLVVGKRELELKDYAPNKLTQGLLTKMMSQGFVVNTVRNSLDYSGHVDIDYRRSLEMKEIYKKLKSLCHKFKDRTRMNLLEGPFLMDSQPVIVSRFYRDYKLPIMKLKIGFVGHYVAGSYVHDYTAAADYIKSINEVLPDCQVKWLNYNPSNNHIYTFELFI